MNKSTLNKPAVIVTVVSVMAVAWLTAQDQPNDTPKATYGAAAKSISVKKINKVSELIGMEVKNSQGEKLGQIQDVVIDFDTDKVGYVVLSTDKGPLTTSKYHAVPLRAFQASADGNSVTLNADKQKLANADGFARETWPSPANPTWGAQPFWNNSPTEKDSKTIEGDRYRDTAPGTTPDRENDRINDRNKTAPENKTPR